MSMLLLSTESLRGYGLNRIFKFAKDANYEGIELALDLRRFDTQNSEYIKELSDQHKLPVRVVKTFESSTIKQSMLALEIAKVVGAKVVVVEAPKLFDFKYKEWVQKQVPVLRKKYDLGIAMKNSTSEYMWGVLPGRSMSSIPDLQNFREVCLDVSNLVEKKMDLMRAYDIMQKYLVHIQISNVYRGKDHSLPDEGILPIESLLTKLKKDNYKFDVALTVTPRAVGAGDDKLCMKNLERVKKFYDKYMG